MCIITQLNETGTWGIRKYTNHILCYRPTYFITTHLAERETQEQKKKKKEEAERDHNVNRHAEFRPIVLVYILHVQPTHNWQSVKASLWNTGCKTCHSLNSWRMVIIQKQTRKTHTKNQPAFHFSLATTAKPLNTRFHIQLITKISVQPVPDEENVVLLLSIFQHTRSPARTCYKQRSMPLTQKPTQPHTFSSMQLNTISPPPPPPNPKPLEKNTRKQAFAHAWHGCNLQRRSAFPLPTHFGEAHASILSKQ